MAGQIDVEVLENWLNETLTQAEFYGIPWTYQNKQKSNQKSMYDYYIDRITLNTAGITNEQCDKLYRALFVNTIGFFGTIKELVSNYSSKSLIKNEQSRHKTKGSLISSVWKVYAILMEFCHPQSYSS